MKHESAKFWWGIASAALEDAAFDWEAAFFKSLPKRLNSINRAIGAIGPESINEEDQDELATAIMNVTDFVQNTNASFQSWSKADLSRLDASSADKVNDLVNKAPILQIDGEKKAGLTTDETSFKSSSTISREMEEEYEESIIEKEIAKLSYKQSMPREALTLRLFAVTHHEPYFRVKFFGPLRSGSSRLGLYSNRHSNVISTFMHEEASLIPSHIQYLLLVRTKFDLLPTA
ncbi:MAG: hypothetical protein Q9164_003856 [Protoblastenia rupestris]